MFGGLGDSVPLVTASFNRAERQPYACDVQLLPLHLDVCITQVVNERFVQCFQLSQCKARQL